MTLCLYKYLVGEGTRKVSNKYTCRNLKWRYYYYKLFITISSNQSHTEYIAVAMTTGDHDEILRYRK